MSFSRTGHRGSAWEVLSQTLIINTEVPQECVLSLIMFSVYTSEVQTDLLCSIIYQIYK